MQHMSLAQARMSPSVIEDLKVRYDRAMRDAKVWPDSALIIEARINGIIEGLMLVYPQWHVSQVMTEIRNQLKEGE